MKVYSIGREVNCDIVINDNTDVISRRHATLNVSSTGKMTIVDLSHNGTYVNGIRISQNVPVPVTRKDNVSFAHVARLDWNLVPNTNKKIFQWSALSILAIVLVLCGVWGYSKWNTNSTEPSASTVVDSISLDKQKEKIEEKEKKMQDSIKKHVQDSLNKVRKKMPTTPTKKVESKIKEPKKTEPKKTEPRKEESKPNRKRG